jgi:hypothetical protein
MYRRKIINVNVRRSGGDATLTKMLYGHVVGTYMYPNKIYTVPYTGIPVIFSRPSASDRENK